MRRPLLFASLLLAFPACGGDSTSTTEDATAGTTDPTTGSGSETGGTDTSGGCPSGELMAKSGDNKMELYGAPCSTDDDCVAILGAGGVCQKDIVSMYLAPGGYCSKECNGGEMDPYVTDAPDCDPNGGVTCIGVNGIFTACAVECQSDEECHRDGYICRVMPVIGADGDAKFCLMPDICTL